MFAVAMLPVHVQPDGQLTFHTRKANWMSLADISKSSSTRNIAEMQMVM